MIASMPKADRTTLAHRNSLSTGGGPRSCAWSQQDDENLIRARAQGLNWGQIAPKHFPSKSANACRKRHERLMEKQHAEQWDGVRLEDLADAYMEVRSQMWRILGDKLGEKWQLVEQKCMEKGFKNLVQASRRQQRKQGTLYTTDDSGFVSDLDEDANENPSPVLTDGSSNQLPMAYQQPAGYHQTRVPSIHSILQHPNMMAQQTNQPLGQPAASHYTSAYGPHN